jgi:hypothetical protein
MPAPNDLVARLADAIAKAVVPILHETWDRAEKETRQRIAEAVVQGSMKMGASVRPADQLDLDIVAKMSPQKRGAMNRVAKGRVKTAVWTVISNWRDEGVSREGIRQRAGALLGEPIKEGSLKQAIRLLKKDRKIETRNSRWYPLV